MDFFQIKFFPNSYSARTFILVSFLFSNVVQADTSSEATKTLFLEGRYIELVDHLRKIISDNPKTPALRAQLVATYLKLDDQVSALEAMEKFMACCAQDEKAQPYIVRLEQSLGQMKNIEESKKEFGAALKNLNANVALTVLNATQVTLFQKGILKTYLSLYQGDFDGARSIVKEMQPNSYREERLIVDKITPAIDYREALFNEIQKKIDYYIYSEKATYSFFQNMYHCPNDPWFDWKCNGQGSLGDNINFLPQEFFGTVNEASKLTPLNPQILNLIFLSMLYIGEYSEIEVFGDLMLKALGRIEVPTYGKSNHYDTIIDARSKRIYNQINENNMTSLSMDYSHVFPIEHSEWREVEIFDLKLENITSIQQSIKISSHAGLKNKSYIAKFNPSGMIPVLPLLSSSASIYGKSFATNAAYNFGKYLVHVIDNPGLNIKLVDPERKDVSWGSFIGAAGVVLGIYAQQTGTSTAQIQNIAQQSQGILQQISEGKAANASNQANLEDWLADEAFGGVDQYIVQSLEEIF